MIAKNTFIPFISCCESTECNVVWTHCHTNAENKFITPTSWCESSECMWAGHTA